jgi:hypothetical protein
MKKNHKLQNTNYKEGGTPGLLGIPNFKIQITNKHEPSPHSPIPPLPQITLYPSLTSHTLPTQIGPPSHRVGVDNDG